MSNPVNSNPVANLTVSATYVVCNLPVLVCIFAFIFLPEKLFTVFKR